VRRASPSLEQSRLTENERAGTDRSDARSRLGSRPEPLRDATLDGNRLRVGHPRHDDQCVLFNFRQRLEIGEDDALVRTNPLARRAETRPVSRSRRIRLVERLERTGEIEDLDLGQQDEDYFANAAISCRTSPAVMMRANLPRNTASVRSMIASVVRVPIGNVSVASVTKSTS
jgi:hypothetical protein